MKKLLLYGLIIVVLAVSTSKLVGAPPPNVGISLTKTPSATKVLSGSSVSYLYNATNTGEIALTGGIYDDVFGPVGYFVDLQPGGWVGFNVTHVITENTTNVATAYGIDQYGRNVTATASAFVEVYYPIPIIESCDSSGTTKDTFDLTDDIYVTGTGYSPSATYDLYVVEDESVWIDGMAIPVRVSGTVSTVSSDAGGNVPATLAWAGPLVPGKYDIVVDVNGDGIYDAEVDALDDSDIKVTAGFFVVPEVPLGTIAASAAMIIALVAYVTKPWSRIQKQRVRNQ